MFFQIFNANDFLLFFLQGHDFPPFFIINWLSLFHWISYQSISTRIHSILFLLFKLRLFTSKGWEEENTMESRLVQNTHTWVYGGNLLFIFTRPTRKNWNRNRNGRIPNWLFLNRFCSLCFTYCGNDVLQRENKLIAQLSLLKDFLLHNIIGFDPIM